MPSFNFGPTVVGLGSNESQFLDLLDLTPDPYFPERDVPTRKLSFLKVPDPLRRNQTPSTTEKLAKLKLDLTRISNRILVMGRCWSHRTDREAHRNNLEEAACFLNARYEKSYLVINLGSPDMKYDIGLFRNQFISFPVSKILTPTIKTLFDACRCMSAWLKLDPENVVVVQCKNGKSRSGLLIACFLRYCGLFDTVYEALELFVSKRCDGDSSWVSSTLKRYLRYFNDILILEGRVPSTISLKLHQVILSTIPDFDGNGGCNPGIEVFQEGKLIYSSAIRAAEGHDGVSTVLDDEIDEELWRELKISMALHPDKFDKNYNPLVMKDEFNIIFRLENIVLSHDVQIRIYHHNEQTGQNVTVFSLAFNTAFMSPGLVRLRKADLETPNNPNGSKFNPQFSVDLVLTPADHERSLVTYETFCERSDMKDLMKLSQYHAVRADPLLTKPLELQDHKKFFVKLALQLGNNDIHAAHEFLSYLSKASFYHQLERELSLISKDKQVAPKMVSQMVDNRDMADKQAAPKIQVVPRNADNPEAILPRPSLPPQDSPKEPTRKVNPMLEALKNRKVESSSGGLPFLDSIKKLKLRDSCGEEPVVEKQIEEKIDEETAVSKDKYPRVNPNPPAAPPLPDFLRHVPTSTIPPAPPLPEHLRHRPTSTIPPAPPLPEHLRHGKTTNSPIPSAPTMPAFLSSIGSMDSLPIPPPFPKASTDELRQSPQPESSQKIKNSLHWSEIKDKGKIENTIWSDLESQQALDVHRFEELFCVNPLEEARNKGLSRSKSFEETQKNMPRILESRRANNVGIGLARFYKRMNNQEIIEAIIKRDHCLDINDLLCLKAIIPQDEERQKFDLYSGDFSVLIPSEQFMYHFSRVKHLNWMIDALIFEAQFPSECESIYNKLTLMSAVLTKIRESPGLKSLFGLVLHLGNLANYDYGRVPAHMRIRGKALGFTMDSLLKLHEVKSVDRKSSLLNYLLQMIVEKYPELLMVPQDFSEMSTVKHWDSESIYSEIVTLKMGFNKFSNLQIDEDDANIGAFRDGQNTFLTMAKVRLDKLTNMASRAKKSWQDTASYLGEDPSEKKPEELLIVFDQFFKQFKEAHDQNLKRAKASYSVRNSASSSALNSSVPSRSSTSSPPASDINTDTTIDSTLDL